MLKPDSAHHELGPPIVVGHKFLELIHVLTHLKVQVPGYLGVLACVCLSLLVLNLPLVVNSVILALHALVNSNVIHVRATPVFAGLLRDAAWLIVAFSVHEKLLALITLLLAVVG
jgi:hypothetical protein